MRAMHALKIEILKRLSYSSELTFATSTGWDAIKLVYSSLVLLMILEKSHFARVEFATQALQKGEQC